MGLVPNWRMEMNYRAYPTDKEMPVRMSRKRLRNVIFYENKLAGNRARAARKKAKKDVLK